MMKRKSIYLLVAACLALAACAEQTETEPAETAPTTTDSPEPSEESQEESTEELTEWSYDGESGPEHWGHLHASYSACVDGSEQSPINIDLAEMEESQQIEEIDIQYEPASFSLVNNGHTIQKNAVDENNAITLDGQEYQLVQFHFHTPSEHQFNGEHFDMELHLVHQDINGNLAVLGVMIEEGAENEELAPAWGELPEEETENDIALEEPINLQNLLPEDQSSFHYNGSLTTPPCTEEVKWIVFKEPIQKSAEQIQAFQEIYEENHRPVQPLNERG
ncbi:carbonic anhydrase [Alkalihalophilus pseudofirmus]|uniref:carbonic anhydrase n=1 Tax=Alkalihalophilus pseudofirmus TaxID=79885 RepID=UPI000951A055|nr:carbonic anhydrase [Alkalihalophilus pseudofirmus]